MGAGKSSILKLILGQSIQYTGLVTLGTGLTISYVQQDTSHLKASLSDYIEEQKIDETLFKSILRKMDFDRIQFEKIYLIILVDKRKNCLSLKVYVKKLIYIFGTNR